MHFTKITLFFLLGCCFLACKNNQQQEEGSAETVETLEAATSKSMELMANISELRLRETPGPDGKVVAVYTQGTIFKDLGEVSDFTTRVQLRGIQFDEPWLKVEAPDGKQGWVYAGGLNFELNTGDEQLSKLLIDKRLETLFGKELKEQINNYRLHFQQAQQVEKVAAVYREGVNLSTFLNEQLDGEFNQLSIEEMPDLFWLEQSVPGFIPQLVAEGTEYMIFEDYRQWLSLAKATASKADDTYFDLCASAYREDSIQYFFPAWTIQTWDYGGHSLLGEGIHLQILKAADLALQRDTLFGPEINAIKAKVLTDITVNYTTFWEPQAAILSEMDSILTGNFQILTKNDLVALKVRRQQFSDPAKHQIEVNHRAGIYD